MKKTIRGTTAALLCVVTSLLYVVASRATAQSSSADDDQNGWIRALFARHTIIPVELAPIDGSDASKLFIQRIGPLALQITDFHPESGNLSGEFVTTDGKDVTSRDFGGSATGKGVLVSGNACSLSGEPTADHTLQGFFRCHDQPPVRATIQAF